MFFVQVTDNSAAPPFVYATQQSKVSTSRLSVWFASRLRSVVPYHTVAPVEQFVIWKVNKVFLGEWEETDERWLQYLKEREIKRNRLDEISKEQNEL